MKKILFVIVAMAMCAGNARAFEYEPEQGFSWMGIFGMNVSKLQNHDFGAKAGAVLGARVDFVLPKAHGTYLTAGLDWTMKGGKGEEADITIDGKDYDVNGKYALHYFEVPIRVGFRYNPTESIGLYGEVGPYFAVGFAGRHKISIDEDGSAFRDIEDNASYMAFKNYGYPTESFQRWDAGIGFRIGAEYNHHYNLLIGCDWGLADIYRVSYRDAFKDDAANAGRVLPKVRNFNFSITFGYRL